jgi:isocitrate dehydrogenase
MSASLIKVPAQGQKIVPGQAIPDNPIIPVHRRRRHRRRHHAGDEECGRRGGREVLRWQHAKFHGWRSMPVRRQTRLYGPDVWLPAETITACKDYSVSIKGPLTTPVGGGIRSLNVALRQEMDLYQCVRPVRYFRGIPSPLKDPSKTDMVIYRENTEDIYCGVEWQAETSAAKKTRQVPAGGDGGHQDSLSQYVRYRHQARLARRHRALGARRDQVCDCQQAQISVPGAQGQYHEVHRGAFRDWGYALAKNEFGGIEIDGGPWLKLTQRHCDQGCHCRRLPAADSSASRRSTT